MKPLNARGGAAVKMKLSKSRFVAGCQCLKRLYWQVHEPELAAQPDGATEAIMQQGHEVGMLARQLFPGGVEVGSDGGLDQAIRATRELIANPEIPAIFEAAFEHDRVSGVNKAPPFCRGLNMQAITYRGGIPTSEIEQTEIADSCSVRRSETPCSQETCNCTKGR
jgi:hypothetical protein